MKKLIALIVIIVIVFSLASCSSKREHYYNEDYSEAYDYENRFDEFGIDEESYMEGYEDGRESVYDDYNIDDYDWMINNVVFTTADNDYYHKVYCEKISDCEIWVHFIEGAKGSGYLSCPECCFEKITIEKE